MESERIGAEKEERKKGAVGTGLAYGGDSKTLACPIDKININNSGISYIKSSAEAHEEAKAEAAFDFRLCIFPPSLRICPNKKLEKLNHQ